jgi:hypothetical protein
MLLRTAALLCAVALAGCGTPQVGDDLAQVCRLRVNNEKGAGQRPECNAYWVSYQQEAFKRGGQAALDAAHAEALSYGNVSTPPPP